MFEGERARTMDNNVLGRFLLSGISSEQRGTAQICVRFAVDENGILSVSARDRATQTEGQLVISKDKGRLTQREIEDMIVSADEHEHEDRLLKGKLASMAGMQHYLYALRKVLEAKDQQAQGKGGKKGKKFKLFEKRKRSKKEEDADADADGDGDEEKESEDGGGVDKKLRLRLERISATKLSAMRELYAAYSSWLREHGPGLMDNEQIDGKQKELESELGANVHGIITESYDIARSLSACFVKPLL